MKEAAINSRQSFYSLTFVDEFNDIGKKSKLKSFI